LTFAQTMRFNERLNIVDKCCHAEIVGDFSPIVKPNWGKFRASPRYGPAWHKLRMSDITRIRALIEEQMKAKGFSRRSLSKAAELSESAVRDLLTRTDNPGIDTLRRIAEALEMPVDQLTGQAAMVPVLGNIGAGGQILFHSDVDLEASAIQSFPMVPRPPLTAGRLMALAVVGSSMLPKYEDGEIIYVRRDHDGILPEYVGRYCAVRTADGGTFLKILAMGSEVGRYTLRSLNAPDMENVSVEWASPVLFVMPKQP
jgi:transcriptional regulator with XRE-family HTH domain